MRAREHRNVFPPNGMKPSRVRTDAQLIKAARTTPGTSPDSTRVAVTAAVADAFKSAPCVGLEYAGEQARPVYSGRQPESTLMPDAR
jgi:hypothetical protein